MPNNEINTLIAIVDQAFDHTSWHGTNLRGSIRRLTAKDAAWRPAPNRHNIWETAVHAAYWKYIVRRRLRAEAKGSFALEGSNWFERPIARGLTEAAWKADIALLVETHETLREAIEKLPPREIHKTPEGSTVSNFALITGIAAHDLYHAGQIQLLKRLRK
jgi:uncharacterized damage-inducible protein DinB